MNLGIGLKKYLTRAQKEARMLADLKTNPKSRYAKLSDIEKDNLIREVYRDDMSNNELFDAIKERMSQNKSLKDPIIHDVEKMNKDYDYNEPFDTDLYNELTRPNKKLENQADEILKKDELQRQVQENIRNSQIKNQSNKFDRASKAIDNLTTDDLPALRDRLTQYNLGAKSSLPVNLKQKLTDKYLELLEEDRTYGAYDRRQNQILKNIQRQYAIDKRYDEYMNPEKYRYRKIKPENYDPKYSQRSSNSKTPINPGFENYNEPKIASGSDNTEYYYENLWDDYLNSIK